MSQTAETQRSSMSGRVPRALDEPTAPVGTLWITLLSLANVGIFATTFAPLEFLLPEQAKLLAGADKADVFSLITMVGAIVSLLVTPIVGALSDRTRSRFGRRHPWTVAGAVVGASGCLSLSVASTVVMLIVGWGVVQLGLNIMTATLTAAVPDRVPVGQRGQVGGFVGIAQNVGTVAGTAIVATLITGIAVGHVTCAIMLSVAALAFALFTRDEPLPKGFQFPRSVLGSLAAMWISPRKHPNFALAWVVNFMVHLTNWLATLYLLYFLGDAVHYTNPASGVVIMMVVYCFVLVAAAVLVGRWSDASGKRKGYLIGSGVVMVIAPATMAAWPTWPGALIASGLLGLGYGMYCAVALAVQISVLPAAADRAKDLGVINIAYTLPQVLAPIIGALVIAHFGGYRILYVLAAGAMAAGVAVACRIKAA